MSTPFRDTEVLLWMADAARANWIGQIVASTGAIAAPIQDVNDVQRLPGRSVAVVGFEESPFDAAASFNIVEQLKTRGFKVIVYARKLLSWPISIRCQILLKGASLLLDCLSPNFAGELSQALVKTLQSEVEEYGEEERLKRKMKTLGFVGSSAKTMTVFRWVMRVSALSDFPVLISGETGTGKELIANALHQLDPKRRKGPFIVTNCSAISAGLAESELFGHRRGAFTGADSERKGFFRAAHGGILFLDEIGELSEPLQAKLLRVLQEKRVLGVGCDQEIPIDVRVVAATNRRLEEMVKAGTFREDLYHRLNGLSVNLPALRERSEDLQPLIEHFIEKYASVTNCRTRSVSVEFVEALARVELPGNARQLENIVRSALLNKTDDSPLNLTDLAPSLWQQISSDLPAPPAEAREVDSQFRKILDQNSWNLPKSLEYCEKIFLQCVLQTARGNQSKVARLIGITPRSVYNKLQKYKLHGVKVRNHC